METKFKKGASLVISSVLMLFILFTSFHASAQITLPTSVIKGPVKAKVNGPHLFLTAEVRGGDTAVVTFSLSKNYSGASIISQGTFLYDQKTGIGEQIVEIDPGNTKGSFTVKALTTNANGKAESSMTVAVVN